MTVAQFTSLSDEEATAVLGWRFSQLAGAGYDLEDAARLAAAVEVDLHAALSLVARGCPSSTALRILL